MKKLCIIFFLPLLACQNNNEDKKKIAYNNNQSGSVTVDEGTTLNYSIKGKGIPFLVIGSDPEYFSKDLYDNFKVYSIETRLNAEKYEPVDTAKYEFDNLLQDIDTVRSVLGIKKFIIGGHSVMGAIAHKYAKKHPEYVSHIVMMGTPRTYGTITYRDSVKVYWEKAPEKRKLLYSEKQKQLQEEKLTQLNPNEAFVKNLVASGPKRWHDANLDATAFFKRINYNLHFLYHLFGNNGIVKYDLCSSEEELDTPIFVALGKSDYIGPPTLWDISCANLSDLTIFSFEESGHTPQYEQSALFNKRLIDWFQKTNK
ncbi:alpha/beta fold hydrolase [Aquimarina sediminis]|uniref:alpha/beta fold hydrolase n=1 Tax=Aquimarina sediminis TaxID=2070536 RepID=UPI000CA009F9|nr:alpha/beta hydrolase [Aquimarina sediminis]